MAASFFSLAQLDWRVDQFPKKSGATRRISASHAILTTFSMILLALILAFTG
jgi:hypothetical protein